MIVSRNLDLETLAMILVREAKLYALSRKSGRRTDNSTRKNVKSTQDKTGKIFNPHGSARASEVTG